MVAGLDHALQRRVEVDDALEGLELPLMHIGPRLRDVPESWRLDLAPDVLHLHQIIELLLTDRPVVAVNPRRVELVGADLVDRREAVGGQAAQERRDPDVVELAVAEVRTAMAEAAIRAADEELESPAGGGPPPPPPGPAAPPW